MKAEIRYLDTCLSDYFQGFGGHVYNVSPYGTCREVKDALLAAVHGEEIFHDGESVDEAVYTQLEASVDDVFAHVRDMDVVFDSLLEAPDEDSETPWAYFGVCFVDE